MKKRILAILLVCIMAVSLLAGCSSGDSGGSGSGGSGGSSSGSSGAGTSSSGSAGSGQSDSAEPAEPVKVGVLLPMSGSTSYYGEVQLGGIQLCVDYINANGGIQSMNGAQIELVVADSTGAAETGMSEFERLVDEGVSAVIGPYNSGVAAATAPLAIQYGVPYIIVNATSENFMGEANKYVYRTNNGSFDFYNVIVSLYNYLDGKLENGLKKVAVVYDSGDWGTGVNSNWARLAEETGAVEIAVSEAVSNAADMTTLVNNIKAADVDLVVSGCYSSDSNLLVRTLNEYQVDTMMFGSGGGFSDAEFISNLGGAAENALLSSSFNPKYLAVNETAAAENEKFKAEFGFDMTFEACWGWTGMATLYDAIERAASPDREAIADALYVTDIQDPEHLAMWFSIYDGIHFATEGQYNETLNDGSLRYNNNDMLGDLVGFVILQVQNGEWVSVLPEEGSQAEMIIVE